MLMFSPASAPTVVQVLRFLEEEEHQRQARQCKARPYHVGKQVGKPARGARNEQKGPRCFATNTESAARIDPACAHSCFQHKL